ncbi:YceI family protein [Gillisia sp. Q332]|uniref:YceI family protein n=1 Tax=Gillisia xinjiangensis TaxID=3384765 RepID=UPI00391DB087
MKTILFFPLLLLFTMMGFSQNGTNNRTIKIKPDSKLTITGDTNISKFLCEFDSEMIPSTRKIAVSGNQEELHFQNAILILDNTGFDCGSKGINKDFHALIQTEKYPEISLELKKLCINTPTQAIADLIITIAGETKAYKVPVKIVAGETPQYRGDLTLNIHDFNLEPPKKMFGLIVVKENIEIKFNLKVEK